MALSNDLRKRVVEAVVEGGLSRNVAAKRFKVSVASAVRWVKRYVRRRLREATAVPGESRRSASIC
jgi:transposase